MRNYDELIDRSDELRSILDESSEGELSEYISKNTADEIGDIFDMLLVMLLELNNDLPKATKYLRAITDSCMNQMVDARTKRERKDLSDKINQILQTHLEQTHRYTEEGYMAARASQDGTFNLRMRTLAEHEHIKELANKIAQNNPKLSKSAIAKILIRKHSIDRAESTIRNIIRDRDIAEDTDPFD